MVLKLRRKGSLILRVVVYFINRRDKNRSGVNRQRRKRPNQSVQTLSVSPGPPSNEESSLSTTAQGNLVLFHITGPQNIHICSLKPHEILIFSYNYQSMTASYSNLINALQNIPFFSTF